MIMSEQLEDLSNLFVLLKGIPHALDPVVAAFRKRVSQQGVRFKNVVFACLFHCWFHYTGLSALKSLLSSKVSNTL